MSKLNSSVTAEQKLDAAVEAALMADRLLEEGSSADAVGIYIQRSEKLFEQACRLANQPLDS